MAKTFFFYDLETSGLSAQTDRIMQFAGQRTDMDLNPIGDPYNVLVKLSDDTLPSPDAILVTGITPQMTQADGYTEAEFAKLLMEEIFTEDTIAVGFNNIRFDDEFIRHLLWRNFYDPYEWTWRDGRSRWDILDVTRMTRALRPEGIEWPFDKDGKAVNKLELLSKINGIDHASAHDALSDVQALIGVTKLIKEKQPELYDYLLKMRDKKAVQELINLDEKKPFVYVSGRYDAEFNKATVAFPLTSGRNGNVVVYNLRHDPTPFVGLDADELRAKLFATWEERQADGFLKIPVKELQYNRCPAVAPLGVLEQQEGWEKVSLTKADVESNLKKLLAHPAFAENIRSVFESKREYPKSGDPEAQLYDGFIDNPKDVLRMGVVRNASADELADLHPEFQDERLPVLLLHYKARSFPKSLSKDEQKDWEAWRTSRLQAQMASFVKSLQRLGATADDSARFVLQELQLWAEDVIPVPVD